MYSIILIITMPLTLTLNPILNYLFNFAYVWCIVYPLRTLPPNSKITNNIARYVSRTNINFDKIITKLLHQNQFDLPRIT